MVIVKAILITVFMPHVWGLIFLIAYTEGQSVWSVLDEFHGSNG